MHATQTLTSKSVLPSVKPNTPITPRKTFQRIGHFIPRCLARCVLLFCICSAVQAPLCGQDQVTQLQKSIDAADAKIREITRKLSQKGLSSSTITRLNRELKDQRWAKSQAQYAIYKIRDRRAKAKNKSSALSIEIQNFEKDVQSFLRQAKILATDLGIYDRDLDSYHAALDRYHSGIRTQAEKDRLDTRKRGLDGRRISLIGKQKYLKSWASRLDAWEKSLDSRLASK